MAELVRVTCERCGVFWDLPTPDMAEVLTRLAIHRADSCHPVENDDR